MGMCASQGRLLTLVSLKSDCELQAQKINNDREALARAEEKLMTEYTDKINNKRLTVKVEGNDVNLTPANLIKANYGIIYKGKECLTEKEIKEAFNNNSKLGEVGEVKNALQFAILNGDAMLIKLDGSGKKAKDAKEEGYSAISAVSEQYYEDDDAAAKSTYDLEMKKVQQKDKKLELQLEQIETRHKTYETEIQSVQQVISKNIEGSYKTFNQG